MSREKITAITTIILVVDDGGCCCVIQQGLVNSCWRNALVINRVNTTSTETIGVVASKVLSIIANDNRSKDNTELFPDDDQ